jgi:hypothetical protein
MVMTTTAMRDINIHRPKKKKDADKFRLHFNKHKFFSCHTIIFFFVVTE